MKVSRKSCKYPCLLVGLLLLVGAAQMPRATAAPAQGSTTYLPFVGNHKQLSYRLGFGATGNVDSYPELTSLRAGWYVNWRVTQAPARPDGIEYVQTVGVHQKLTCALGSRDAYDRNLCPYAVPYDYIVMPDWQQIASAARANPGSLWLIGNEMDRRDWPGGGQDEMVPELYAVAYHDLYTLIKQVDPSAKVAIGGVIQATPLRLEYLSQVWDRYAERYGTMPVDVWNVHNFILKENINDYGASVPPGSAAQTGVLYGSDVGGDSTHVSMSIFDNQIRAFRAWMRARGQQNKPLIVSEYGILYAHIPEADTAEEVQNWMVGTFDYFLNAKDCSLGYPEDDCRLVQRWNWYSLDDKYGSFNQYGALFDPLNLSLTETGARYRSYSLTHLGQLAQ